MSADCETVYTAVSGGVFLCNRVPDVHCSADCGAFDGELSIMTKMKNGGAVFLTIPQHLCAEDK